MALELAAGECGSVAQPGLAQGDGTVNDTVSDRKQWKGPDFTVQVFN